MAVLFALQIDKIAFFIAKFFNTPRPGGTPLLLEGNLGVVILIIGHPWPQPFGRLSFGNRPIRFSLPNCVAATFRFIFQTSRSSLTVNL